jgi:plastocyanin
VRDEPDNSFHFSRFFICDMKPGVEQKKALTGGDLNTRQKQSRFMKIVIGVFILVIFLAAVTGCTTQQAKPAATVTIITTTAPATEVLTILKTPLPQTVTVKETATVATPRPSPAPSATFSGTNIIHIRNNIFVPDELTVLPGTGVVWINDDSVIHIVKATGDSAGKFTSVEIVKGAEFHYTFGENTGTFEFEDPKYPDMKGAIIVRKGESVVGASSLISQGSS